MEIPKNNSRKLSVLAAILILFSGIFIGGYLVLKSGRGAAGELNDLLSGKNLISGTCEPNAGDAQKDSDNDGLKDWQEIQVYKTDACKPDSDGDGYLDGEEVASGYDPAKKAPGDELAGAKQTLPRPLPQNLTEALRQSLLGQIKSNQIQPFSATGGLLSGEDIQNYPALQQSINEIIANSSSLFAAETIDESQIKISKDSSPAAIRRYAAAAYAAIPDVKDISSPSESEMFIAAIEQNNFLEMDKLLQGYQEGYAKLKNLTVPENLLSLHLEQLNIFSSLIKIYQAVKEINSDPLKANLALQSYQAVSERIASWLENLSQFIEENQ